MRMNKAEIIFVKSWCDLPDTVFSGIAYTPDSVIIGELGFEKYKLNNEFNACNFSDGRFALFSRTDSGYVAKTDELGQETLFYYYSNGKWALSNSFFYLVEQLKKANCTLSIRKSALIAPFVKHALCQQLVSNNTGIEEIKVLPLKKEIVISGCGKYLSLKDVELGKRVESIDEYKESLLTFAASWSSRFHALINRKPDLAFMDLSGGYDSRILLGLAIRSGTDLTKINIRSNKNYSEDYQIAELLSSTYGFQLSSRSLPGKKANSSEAYMLWKYGNLGIYFPVYIPVFSSPPQSLHFHGAGGELHRSYYTKSANVLARNLKGSLKDDVKHELLSSEFLESIKTMGANPEESDSMARHYTSFRSRFHFGRNWVRSCSSPIITPLASGTLKLASDFLNDESKNNGKLLCDLFYMLDPALAVLPFDKPEKSFSKESIFSVSIKNASSFIESRMTNYNIYEGANDGTKNQNDLGFSYENNIQDCFLTDFYENQDMALASGLIDKNYIINAKEMLLNSKRMATDYLAASHIISIGEMMKATS